MLVDRFTSFKVIDVDDSTAVPKNGRHDLFARLTDSPDFRLSLVRFLPPPGRSERLLWSIIDPRLIHSQQPVDEPVLFATIVLQDRLTAGDSGLLLGFVQNFRYPSCDDEIVVRMIVDHPLNVRFGLSGEHSNQRQRNFRVFFDQLVDITQQPRVDRMWTSTWSRSIGGGLVASFESAVPVVSNG